MKTPVLYIFSGLPGTGKTTLAQRLSFERAAFYVRIDTLEQALRDLCDLNVEGEGYDLAYRIAAENLRLGLSVVADSCNPIDLTRRAWMQIAEDEGAGFFNIELTCSDPQEHRRRVETRTSSVPGLIVPTWEEVVTREYEPWVYPTIEIDTAHNTIDESFSMLLSNIAEQNEMKN